MPRKPLHVHKCYLHVFFKLGHCEIAFDRPIFSISEPSCECLSRQAPSAVFFYCLRHVRAQLPPPCTGRQCKRCRRQRKLLLRFFPKLCVQAAFLQAACPVAMFPRRGAQSTTVEHFLDLVLAQEAAPTRFFLYASAMQLLEAPPIHLDAFAIHLPAIHLLEVPARHLAILHFLDADAHSAMAAAWARAATEVPVLSFCWLSLRTIASAVEVE